MEPSAATKQEIGQLCMAWSFLEAMSEKTLWGIVDADEKFGPLITWRLDVRSRWQMILDHAHKKHDEVSLRELRAINKQLVPITRDRNIIVHGLVHAVAVTEAPSFGRVLGTTEDKLNFARVPCWTIYRGAEGGKNFAVSTKAVEIVRENIQKIGHRILEFNKTHNYTKSTSTTGETIESDWPKLIE